MKKNKKKIKVFITIEEKGLFGKIKSFFLKQRIKWALKGLRGLPLEKIQEVLIEAMTKDGNYKIIKDEKGTTLIREDSCTTKEQ